MKTSDRTKPKDSRIQKRYDTRTRLLNIKKQLRGSEGRVKTNIDDEELAETSIFYKRKMIIEHRPSRSLDRFEEMLKLKDNLALIAAEKEASKLLKNAGIGKPSLVPVKPVYPALVVLHDIARFRFTNLQTKYCFRCWGSVSYGTERISCRSCPLIAHKECIDDIKPFTILEEYYEIENVNSVDIERTALSNGVVLTNTNPDPSKSSQSPSKRDKMPSEFSYRSLQGQMTKLNDPLSKLKRLNKASHNAPIAHHNGDGGGLLNDNLGAWLKNIEDSSRTENEDAVKKYRQMARVSIADEVKAVQIRAATAPSTSNTQRQSSKRSSVSRSDRDSSVSSLLVRTSSVNEEEGNGKQFGDPFLAITDRDFVSVSLHTSRRDSDDEFIQNVLGNDSAFDELDTSRVNEAKSILKVKEFIKWFCPFCEHGLNAHNVHAWTKYNEQMKYFLVMTAILKLQSLARMIPMRKKWRIISIGVRRFQSMYHAKYIRRKLLQKKLRELRPFRVRIHEIELAVRTPEDGPLHKHTSAHSRAIGQTSATTINDFLNESSGVVPPASLSAMLSLLRASPGSREYSLPVEMQPGQQEIPSSSVILTVTVDTLPETKLDESKQLYRMDVLLREQDMSIELKKTARTQLQSQPSAKILPAILSSPSRINLNNNNNNSSTSRPQSQQKPIGLPLQSQSSMRKQVSILQTPLMTPYNGTSSGMGMNDNSNKNKIIIRFFLPKQLIMFPSPPGNVSVTFTISEVTEWPKAVIIGQTRKAIDKFIIWKQIASFDEDFCGITQEDVPIADSNSKCSLSLPIYRQTARAPSMRDTRNELVVKRKSSIESISSDDASSQASSVKGGGHSRSVATSANTSNIARIRGFHKGTIKWTLMPSSLTGVRFGNLLFLSQPSLSGSKKRQYSVLVDRTLLIYGNSIDVKPKEVIDMKQYVATVIDGEIVKLNKSRAPPQAYFIHCPISTYQGKEWMQALQEQSANSDNLTATSTISRIGSTIANMNSTSNSILATSGVVPCKRHTGTEDIGGTAVEVLTSLMTRRKSSIKSISSIIDVTSS